MTALTEYIINDKTYIDIKDIRSTFKAYCKGTRSIPQLIDRKGYRDIIYGSIVDGSVQITQTMSRKHGTTFVNKIEVAELFNAPEEELPLAPPILSDKDLVFFKDEEGNEYKVLMRGERTRKGIYFKVRDVEQVFQMPRLEETVTRSNDSSYKLGAHYNWFRILPFPTGSGNQHNKQRELYLTYKGLMRVIYRSNSGIACKFADWIDDCVFAMNWGTKEQKAKVVSRALDLDASQLTTLMAKYPTKLSCLYLIDIKDTASDKRVFKYGFTDSIRRRFREHTKRYHANITLDSFVFIPMLDLSKAEALFKRSVSKYKVEREGEDELICLCPEAYQNIQTILSTISEKYCGNIREQVAYFGEQITDLKHKLELSDANHATEVSNLHVDLVSAKKDLEVYAMKIQLLEMKIHMLESKQN